MLETSMASIFPSQSFTSNILVQVYTQCTHIFTFCTRQHAMLLLPSPTFSMPTYFARPHQGKTWKVFETVFLNHFPDPVGHAVWRDGGRTEGGGREGASERGGGTEGGEKAVSHISHVLSKGSGGTPSDTDGSSERLKTEHPWVVLQVFSRVGVRISVILKCFLSGRNS